MTSPPDFGMAPRRTGAVERNHGNTTVPARVLRLAPTLWLGLSLVACAALPPALMEVPAELSSTKSLVLPVPGTRSGQFELSESLGGGKVRFERSADRWSYFSTVDLDRATLTVRWEPLGQPSGEQDCRLRRTGLQVAGVGIDLQPIRLVCEGSGTRLELQARPDALRAGRGGSVTRGTQTLEIRSVHRIQGTPLTRDEPAGYVLLDQGRPVAALDMLGARPLLHLGGQDAGQRQLAVESALLLALNWEPAD